MMAALLITGVLMPVHAEIALDGSVGTAGKLNLSGPDYDIKAEYGHQSGSNLFHSFQHFNIHTGESAVFSGPESVQNIVTRVTGGNISAIDGVLGSSISGADLYLLNPAGVMFGANAALDISGSFHVSTGNYLRLGENDRFYAMPHESDVLSAAAPTAFGFLDENAGKISIEGKGELTSDSWGEDYDNWRDWYADNHPGFSPGLVVPEGKSISMMGGDIEISGTYFDLDGTGSYQPVGQNLSAGGGRVSLAAVKSPGEVRGTASGLDISAEKLGNITMSQGAKIEVSAGEESEAGAGSVFIRGENFVLGQASHIVSETFHTDGQIIDIHADRISLENESRIDTNTYGTGSGTNIVLDASEEINIINGKVKSGSFGSGIDAGNGGTFFVKTKNLSVTGTGSLLGGDLYGSGKGGDINIEASESVYLSDEGATIASRATEWSTGQAGDITVHTPKMIIENKARISSESSGAGRGGNIGVHTEDLEIASGGKISVRAEDTGDSGSITISGADPLKNDDFANTVALSGEETIIRGNATGIGNAGTISIAAKQLSVTENASVSTSSSGAGNAGNIALKTQTLVMDKSAHIDSASEYTDSKIYVADDEDSLAEFTDAAQGDIAIVKNPGNGNPTLFICYFGGFWVRIGEENVSTVAELWELDLLMAMDGDIAIVEDIGDGTPGGFVFIDYFFEWIKIKNIYSAADISERDGLIAFNGDIMLTKSDDGSQITSVYTGEKWITFQDVYTVPDIEARNQLSAKPGDVAKVSDAGAGTASSFIYDGTGWTDFYMTGNAGTLTIHADEGITLKDDAYLSTASSGGIQAGTIHLNTPNLKLSGTSKITATSKSVGDAGTLQISADNMTLNDNAALTTETLGQGKGGDITIETASLEMRNNAAVSSASTVAGKGGDAGTISITSSESVHISDQASVGTSAEGEGNAGSITMNLSQLKLENGASVSSESRAEENGGAAGMISVHAADSIHLFSGSSLTTEAVNTGVMDETEDRLNGRMTINAGNLLYLSDSEITTSVRSGLGNGGNIDIGNPEFVTLNNSQIKANAYEGRGGNIHIVTDQFIQSAASLVSASSELGIDGSIEIESPDEDISSGLTVMPGNFLDAARWMRTPCGARTGENISRFILMGRDAAPTVLNDWLPSPILEVGNWKPDADDQLSSFQAY